jgi:hypothetical protein
MLRTTTPLEGLKCELAHPGNQRFNFPRRPGLIVHSSTKNELKQLGPLGGIHTRPKVFSRFEATYLFSFDRH